MKKCILQHKLVTVWVDSTAMSALWCHCSHSNTAVVPAEAAATWWICRHSRIHKASGWAGAGGRWGWHCAVDGGGRLQTQGSCAGHGRYGHHWGQARPSQGGCSLHFHLSHALYLNTHIQMHTGTDKDTRRHTQHSRFRLDFSLVQLYIQFNIILFGLKGKIFFTELFIFPACDKEYVSLQLVCLILH